MALNIMMTRPNLEAVPTVSLPEGYSLVSAETVPALPQAWSALINEAFEEPQWTEESVVRDYISQPQYDAAGVFFVLHENMPVATAFAWLDAPDECIAGRVHWVGTLPEHRGKGLAGAVVLAVLHYLAERGFRSAFLETQAFRIPAIRLYTALGFQPEPRNEEELLEWGEPVRLLGLEAIQS
jgi:mycothiol synthase